MENEVQISKNERIVFAGGCFWCTEAVFLGLKGVQSARPGYAGGHKDNPTYEQVSTGETGHAESVEIRYDPKILKFSDLLAVFFGTHDPTTPNRQGNDVGTQYRSAVFYTTDKQKEEVEKFIEKLEEDGLIVVTEIRPLEKFWPAEDYHKKYYESNKDTPYCRMVVDPKLAKLRKNFQTLLKV